MMFRGHLVIGLFGFAAAGCLGASPGATPAEAIGRTQQAVSDNNDKVDDVRVVNTTAQPVPVAAQGTTQVAGSVGAQQQGAWSVSVAGTANVSVAPGEHIGIDPARNAVQIANSDPIAVAGAVSAAQSGPWSVGIEGTPTVALAPGGSVALSGTPSVTLAGPVNLAPGATVGLSGTASVTVTNAETNPLPTRNVAYASGFWTRVSAFVSNPPPGGANVLRGNFAPAVPSGKRFVIEHASVDVRVPPDIRPLVSIEASPLALLPTVAFQGNYAHRNGIAVPATWTAELDVRAYTDMTPSVTVDFDQRVSNGDVVVTLFGYLIDRP